MSPAVAFTGVAKACLRTAVLFVLAGAAAVAQTAPPSPHPLPPAQYMPAHDYDQRNIKLDLRFDWTRQQAIGTAAITLTPVVKDLRRVDLDAAFLTVSGVTLAAGTPLKFENDTAKQRLSIALDRAYQPGDDLTLVVGYHTNQPPAGTTSGGGLTFITPRAGDPARPRQIWSQGEAEWNHFWFPCFDHPNDFLTSEIVATVEKPLSVISNGKLVSVKENADGTRTYDWRIDQPHATYLTSIVVGEYASATADAGGIPVVTNVYPGELAEGTVTAARLPEMVKFFAEKTGVPYPYAKYAQTMTRDFGGGMENISATTMTDSMIHDARTELDSDSDSLQSHELAHQWFGDDVTCRTWSDVWLNESFATYFQAMWDEHRLGRDAFLYLDVKSNQDQYYQTWSRGQRRPIVTNHYDNADAVFDTYAYPRGGAVLHMLRTVLGEDAWWRAIHHYLTKYAHQPVETGQFRIAVEEATGQPMDWFFEEWVYRMGHPIFQVTQNYDAAAKSLTLKVRQEQHPDPDSLFPQVTFFQTPVDIEIGTAVGSRVERVRIAAQEEQTFTFAVDAEPLLVNFDYGGALIKELVFSRTNAQLLYQLAHDQDVLGRIGALQQLAARLKDAATTAADRSTMLKAIGDAATKDAFWGTRLEAVMALNGVADAKDALLGATRDAHARVRVRAVTALAATRDAGLAAAYQPLLGDPSYAVIRAAAVALGQTKGATAYDALVKLVDLPSWHDTIRASALNGLAALGDTRAAALGFKHFVAGSPISVRTAAAAVLGATGQDDPRTFPLISGALSESVDGRDFGLFASDAEALVALGDARGVAVFQELAKKAGTPPNMVAALAAYEQRLRARLAPKLQR